MDNVEILGELNSMQKQAVVSDALQNLVLAGAGSGKTKVLVHRVAWVIYTGQCESNEVLAVTFTNKAAGEMRSRIKVLTNSLFERSWVGTFHGTAHKMLRLHFKEAGLNKNFQIIDSDDQARIIKRVIKELNLVEFDWSAKEVQARINTWKDRGLRPNKLVLEEEKYDSMLKRIYEEYQNLCERSSLVDFPELLLRTFELLKSNSVILKMYKNRFAHIMVDEFQDTSSLQYKWLKLFVDESKNFFVVGDDDQSIYSWRGAKVENMSSFQRDYPEHKITRLEQNYRSTSKILKAANVLIKNNTTRIGKELWTNEGDGEKIALFNAYNDQDEARYIVDLITSSDERKECLSENAILYRVSAQSRVFEDALRERNVNYKVYGGFRFYERAEIKDVIAYLRLALSKDDDSAFERVVNIPARGIGLKTIQKFRQESKSIDKPLWYTAFDLSENKELSNKVLTSLDEFKSIIEGIQNYALNNDLESIIKKTIELSGLEEHYRQEKSGRGLDRIENLQELMVAARDFVSSEESMLAAFVTHAALEAGEGQSQDGEDCVQLMTLHSAKGLEFKFVYLVGLEDGLFPHNRSLNNLSQLEEERRLCYVGITRARQRLTLSYAESRRLHGSEHSTILSRFVREIPSDLIQSVRAGGRFSSLDSTQTGESGLQLFKLGQSVHHKVFGTGIVLDFEGKGTTSRVQVRFADSGTKWLVTSYAGLTPL